MALEAVAQVCGQPDVAQGVYLQPGQMLLINNRKGAHSRTPFTARFDGTDRWLQRLYVRRSLWELRKRLEPITQGLLAWRHFRKLRARVGQ